MIHRSEQVPSALLTVVIAAAAVFVLLAISAQNELLKSHGFIVKSIICVLAIFMINRIGMTNKGSFLATMLFALLIIVENPFIPIDLSESHWRTVHLLAAALFAAAATASVVRAAALKRRSRVALDKRSARTGFRN